MPSEMEFTNPSGASYATELVIGQTFCPDHGKRCRNGDCMRRFGTWTGEDTLYTRERPSAAQLTAYIGDEFYKIESRTRQTPQGRERARAARAGR